MKEAAKVMNYFDRASVSFDSLYSETRMNSLSRSINRLFRRDIYERFMRTIQHIKESKAQSVLDVGCGSGRYARAFMEIGVVRIVGIDISKNMIDLAREHTQDASRNVNPCQFVQGDFMGFSTTEIFDVVVAMGFFDYVEDPITILKRMKVFTTQSVIASFPSISWYRTPIRKVRYFYKKCPVYFYNPDQIQRLSQDAGFARCDIEKIRGAGMDYFVKFWT